MTREDGTVARVRAAPPDRVAALIPEVAGRLGGQAAFEHGFDHLGEEAAIPGQRELAGVGVLQPRRKSVARRARIIAAHPELRERELTKLASWSTALVEILRGRGLSGPDAQLLAEVSVAVFRVAYRRWLDERPERELVAVVHEALSGFGGFFGHTAPEPRRNRPRMRDGRQLPR